MNMEPQTTNLIKHHINKVTPLSKALAAILFIILPFVGLYIGYTFAPEKVVEVERVVVHEVVQTNDGPYVPGEEFQLYTVSSIQKTKVNSSVALVFTDSAKRKLTGTVRAYYSFYFGEYTLQFVPDDNYAMPVIPDFETPVEIRLVNSIGDLTNEINKLCGTQCVPAPDASLEEIESFDEQGYEWDVVVAPVYITYEYYNAGAGTGGSYITITDIERK